ncbi:MAG: hypothetical protein MZW92_10590 [Comamonadaceae bacterium]|nr:hypothetical protein [Comamonadaceae bacterium]
MAIAAGYLGLFSGPSRSSPPLALLFGVLAAVDIKKHKDKPVQGSGRFSRSSWAPSSRPFLISSGSAMVRHTRYRGE